ncbi:MAG: WYL domain-containing protein [Saprospiraceae bacterium]|nr:WYL domain-containing protein [Saprospiraceae bacterium]
MAQSKNALIRYKTIDKCLRNTKRRWTLQDLIEACSDALYEYEGRDVNVSKRTIQLDLQLMRSNKLGYNAPIEVYAKKFYRYSDPTYSITNIPLSEHDLHVLTETVEVLRQFKDFSLFAELGGIIQKLEDTVHSETDNAGSIIHLDKNEQLKGLSYLDPLYQAILKQICVQMQYQSFRARRAQSFVFHPYILKEFNNRWFVVGRKDGQEKVLTLALDRIEGLEYNLSIDYKKGDFDGDAYYANTIGVTVLDEKSVKKVMLRIDRKNAPYVLTKPFHHSQKFIKRDPDGSILIELRVHLNFEFERLILGFGESLEVETPKSFRKRIKRKLERAYQQYY